MNNNNTPFFSLAIDRKSIQTAGKVFLLIFLFLVSLYIIWIALTQFKAVALPFLFSILLTFLLDPPICYLERKGFSRLKGTFVIFLAILLIVFIGILLVFPVLTTQIQEIQTELEGDALQNRISDITLKIQDKLSFLKMGAPADSVVTEGQEIAADGLASKGVDAPADDLTAKLESALTKFHENMLNFALGLFSALSNLVIIPFITFFLLKDGPSLKKAIIERVPNRYFEMFLNLIYKIEQQLGAYIRGQMIDATLIGILSIIALYFLGIDYYFFIGAIAGLANLIPYLGPVVGAVPAILVSLMMPDPSLSPILWIIIAFAVIQLIDNVVISPLVVAKSVNIHPLVVIIVIFIGERLLGVLGMLIAVPVTGILNVIIRETIWSFKNYRLL